MIIIIRRDACKHKKEGFQNDICLFFARCFVDNNRMKENRNRFSVKRGRIAVILSNINFIPNTQPNSGEIFNKFFT